MALKDTFLKADSPTVLAECVGTMQHAVASSSGALQDRCREVFNDLTAASLEKLAETARLVTTRKRCDPSDPEDEYVFALNGALLRTLQLLQAGAKDLAESDSAYEVFATLLGEGAKVELAEEVLGRVILNVFRILLWNLAALDSAAEPAAVSAEALRGRLEAFVRAIEDVYDATDDPKLRNTVFTVLTDLMLTFSSEKLCGTRARRPSCGQITSRKPKQLQVVVGGSHQKRGAPPAPVWSGPGSGRRRLLSARPRRAARSQGNETRRDPHQVQFTQPWPWPWRPPGPWPPAASPSPASGSF